MTTVHSGLLVMSRDLSRRVDSFVLRRTAEVNAKHLPPLSKYTIFCRPAPLQVRLPGQDVVHPGAR